MTKEELRKMLKENLCIRYDTRDGFLVLSVCLEGYYDPNTGWSDIEVIDTALISLSDLKDREW